ncbi:hypothetical protein HWI79_2632 [Cryptosporidium felis]|nr:hypothetical protein HWI79_2632 [Cryptosporidium felis]
MEELERISIYTPRRPKVVDDETIIFAPDPRKARKQINFKFSEEKGWNKEFCECTAEDFRENIDEKDLKLLLLNFPRSSVEMRNLVTPKHVGGLRDSILSTGASRGETKGGSFDLTFDCISVYGNDSDTESYFERDEFSDLKTDVAEDREEIEGSAVNGSEFLTGRLAALCKRGRETFELEIGNESPTDLVRIMSKSLKLS